MVKEEKPAEDKTSFLALFPTTQQRGQSEPSTQRCEHQVRVVGTRLVCAAIVIYLLAGGASTIRKVYPEHAMWLDRVCTRTDTWRDPSVGENGQRVSSQRERTLKHYPALNSPALWLLELAAYGWRAFAAPGPDQPTLDATDLVILVGAHHKTGSVLARKVLAHACVALRQCGHFHVTSGSEADVKQSVATPGVRLVSHPQWAWLPAQLVPAHRPYLFLHFWRLPAPKIASGYVYHLSGVERWTTAFKFRAADVCQPQRSRSASGRTSSSSSAANSISRSCDALKICRPCCVEVLNQGNLRASDHGVGSTSSFSHVERASLTRGGSRASSHSRSRSRISSSRSSSSRSSSSSNSRRHRSLSAKSSALYSTAEIRAARTNGDRALRFLCTQMSSVPDLAHAPSAAATNSSTRHNDDGDMASSHGANPSGNPRRRGVNDFRGKDLPGGASLAVVLRELSLEHGLLFEAGMQWFENYRMAQLVNRTRHDPRVLHLELGAFMGNYQSAIAQLFSFLSNAGPAMAKAFSMEQEAAALKQKLKTQGSFSNGSIGSGAGSGNGRHVRSHSKSALSSAGLAGLVLWDKSLASKHATLLQESLTYNMGSSSSADSSSKHSSLYAAVYNSPFYQHGTASASGTKGKEAASIVLSKLMCEHADLRALYEPVFALLNLPEGSPGRPRCSVHGKR